jgi:hypothetical protein
MTADSTTRFSNRAELYSQHRPDYPVEAIEAMLGAIAAVHSRSVEAADVGRDRHILAVVGRPRRSGVGD